jgi:hypothetical protein
VHVFVDLGDDHGGDGHYSGGDGGGITASAKMTDGGGENDGSIHIDVDDGDEDDYESLEKLRDEWDGLLKELETMSCGSGNSDEDFDVVDTAYRSDRDVDSICVAIDLTQRLSPHMRGDCNRDRTSSSSHTRVRKSVDERMRMRQTLNRLKSIHDKILGSQQRPRRHHSPSPLVMGRQLERLKAKVLRLQSMNADLNSQANSLQTTNQRLSLCLSDMKRTATDATVEAERAVLRYETLDKKCGLMDESYRRHVERSTLDKNLLQNEIIKLQAKYARLSEKSDLYDMREMDEIRAKYQKMSQEVHDLKSKNVRLSEECERKEREWEVRYRKEIDRSERLLRQVNRFSELVGSDTSKSSGGVGRAFACAGRSADDMTSANNVDSGHRVRNKPSGVNNRALAATSAANRRDVARKIGGRDIVKDSNPFGLAGKAVAPILEMYSSFASDANGHTTQKSSRTNANDSIDVAVGRAYTTTLSLSDGKACRGRKAMEALDKATSRKNANHLKGQLQLVSRISGQCRLSHDSVPHIEESQRDESSEDNLIECSNVARITSDARTNAKRAYSDEILLLMKTGLPHASNKRRHFNNFDSIKNLDDDDAAQSGRKSDSRGGKGPSIEPIRSDALDLATAASSSSSRKAILASYSPKRKGNIASYFKPPLAERSNPAHKPQMFVGNHLSTSLS